MCNKLYHIHFIKAHSFIALPFLRSMQPIFCQWGDASATLSSQQWACILHKCCRDFVGSEAMDLHFVNSNRRNICPNKCAKLSTIMVKILITQVYCWGTTKKSKDIASAAVIAEITLAPIFDSANTTPRLILSVTIAPHVTRTTLLGPSYSTITQQAQVTIAVLNVTNILDLKKSS